jgi:hypothetical protein
MTEFLVNQEAATTGFQVDPAALAVTADGVQGVLDELGRLGVNGEQISGSPVTNLALSLAAAGTVLVSGVLGDLLDRAHYVFRDLLANAEQMVTRLRSTRTHYQQVEHTIAGKFANLGDALAGAPTTGGAW